MCRILGQLGKAEVTSALGETCGEAETWPAPWTANDAVKRASPQAGRSLQESPVSVRGFTGVLEGLGP